MKSTPHNIYIHVPYCMSKCNYCAFFSQACARPDWKTYTDNVCREIKYWGQRLNHPQVPTIFFGGGTPSLIPTEHFHQIIKTANDCFTLNKNAEITLESNPGTLSYEKLAEFKHGGVNRLSVGVQRLNNNELNFMGRKHTVDDATRLIHTAQDMHLNVSADFIYGIPGDTTKSVLQICQWINDIGIQHCSLYELTIEPNSAFGKMNLNMPSNDEMAQMYMAIEDGLRLNKYEVSNYAAYGAECKHNQNIWDGGAYIGIGRGGAGRVFQDNVWYEQMGNNELMQAMDDTARATEKVIMGLRTIRGCQLTDDVKSVIDIDWIGAHPELIQIHDGRLRATKMGMLVLDEVTLKTVK